VKDLIDQSQLNRGTLEGCIMRIISTEETYGYEIVTKLQGFGFEEVKEGTIYPILVRLEKKGLISSLYKQSPLGPKRKYYFITAQGEQFIQEFIKVWNEVKESVDRIFKGE